MALTKVLLLVLGAAAFAAAADRCLSSSLSASINAMGSQLVKNLGEEGNYFVSPMSVHTALAMTYLGATGKTAEEMENAFRVAENGLDKKEFHEYYSKLLEVYTSSNDAYSLMVANGVFVQEDYTVKDTYVNGLRSYYKAAFRALDFQKNGDSAKDEINKWVAENTRNMIDKLLSEPLSPSTKLALLNAVYFKGTWKTQFNKETTFDAVFFKNEKSSKRVKFMHQHKEKYPYLEDADTGYKFLEMPYKGEDIVMLFALPKRNDYKPDLEMTSSLLCRVRQGLRKVKLDWVKIPKFHLEYSTELKEPLKGLGINRLFTGEADLDKVSDAGDLHVSSVMHKAVIDVNEEGSEAAAVTGVIIENRMGIFDQPEFVADRPFLFYIVDKRNSLVLFSGRVVEP